MLSPRLLGNARRSTRLKKKLGRGVRRLIAWYRTRKTWRDGAELHVRLAIIVERSQVLWADDSLDFTNELIRRYNKAGGTKKKK